MTEKQLIQEILNTEAVLYEFEKKVMSPVVVTRC